jgi:hypothetical protein
MSQTTLKKNYIPIRPHPPFGGIGGTGGEYVSKFKKIIFKFFENL